MKNHIRLLLMLVTILALTACGAKPPTAAPESLPTASPASPPNALITIEAAAEDIIDVAPSGNWEKIGGDVTDIANAWKSYQPQAGTDGAPQETQDAMTSALAELQTASTAKDSAATMQASNNVSAVVVDLFSLYNPKVPAEIGRLDVLERQVILDVAAKNYPAAMASLTKTKSVWEAIKPSALEHNGKDVAAEFDNSLAIQETALTAGDDAGLTKEAKNGLEIVDALELLY